MYSKKGETQLLNIVLILFISLAFLSTLLLAFNPNSASYAESISSNEKAYLGNDIDMLIRTLEAVDSNDIYYNYSNPLNEKYYIELNQDSVAVFHDPSAQKYVKKFPSDKNIMLIGGFEKSGEYSIIKKDNSIIFGKAQDFENLISQKSCPVISYTIKNKDIVIDQLNRDKSFANMLSSLIANSRVITSDKKEDYFFSEQILIGAEIIGGDKKIEYVYDPNNSLGELIGCNIANSALMQIDDIKISSLTFKSKSTTDPKYMLLRLKSPAVYIEVSGLTQIELSLLAKIISDEVNAIIKNENANQDIVQSQNTIGIDMGP